MDLKLGKMDRKWSLDKSVDRYTDENVGMAMSSHFKATSYMIGWEILCKISKKKKIESTPNKYHVFLIQKISVSLVKRSNCKQNIIKFNGREFLES